MRHKLNDGERWTAAEIERLIDLVHVDKLSNAEIGVRLNRTKSAIETAVNRYAIRAPDATRRNCMTCRRPFFSKHKGNRICAICVRTHELECA